MWSLHRPFVGNSYSLSLKQRQQARRRSSGEYEDSERLERKTVMKKKKKKKKCSTLLSMGMGSNSRTFVKQGHYWNTFERLARGLLVRCEQAVWYNVLELRADRRVREARKR